MITNTEFKMETAGWRIVIVCGIIFGSIHPILINLGKDSDGKILFSSASVAFCVEFLKLAISLLFVLREVCFSKKRQLWPPMHVVLLYAVPSSLYTVVNNLVTHAQKYMDPSSFQIMNNLKIVSTALFYRLFISSELSRKKWLAVALLFLGGVVNSFGGIQENQGKSTVGKSKETFITTTGIYIMCMYCCVSGLAGVYTEAVLKKYKQSSIYLQNSILYGFGTVINALLYEVSNIPTSQEETDYRGFFEGFSVYTWLIVFTQALNGIIISLIMKHLSNITRLIMMGVCMVMTTFLSFLIFGYGMNVYFVIAFCLVMTALYIYYDV